MTKRQIDEKMEWYLNRGYDLRKIRGGFELYINNLLRERYTRKGIELWPA